MIFFAKNIPVWLLLGILLWWSNGSAAESLSDSSKKKENKIETETEFETEINTKSLKKITVTGGRGADLTGIANTASQGHVDYHQLEQRPLLRPGELLEVIPGMMVTQHSGPGKANQYFLRGFNLDHGTDFAASIDGIPLNLPSHAHGQGYLDLNGMIPELVEDIEFKKGPYYAEVGDFSSAGSAAFRTFDRLPQGIASLTLGEFDYYRAVLANSSTVGGGDFLYAGEFKFQNGPWVTPNDARFYKGLFKYTIGDDQQKFSVKAHAYHANWNSTDQIPLQAVEDGLISRYGSVDPTDGGITDRYTLGLNWLHDGDSTTTEINAYGYYYDLNLYSNFTYFLDDPINGDQINQRGRRWVAGANGKHSWFLDWNGREVTNTVGMQFRHDHIGEVGIFHTRARQRLNAVADDRVYQSSIGWYGENLVKWTNKIRSVIGLRGDFYNFDVTGLLNPENSGDVATFMASPKFSLIFGPWAKTEYFLNAGYDFHSNDAREIVEPSDPDTEEITPLARSKGAEVGVRSSWLPKLTTTVSLWYLNLDSELVFDGDEGTNEPSGESNRYGVEWSNYYRPLDWLTIDADFSFSKAQFINGDAVPNSMGRVISAGVTANWPTNPNIFGAIRLRHFGDSPLTELSSGNVFAKDTTLVNLKLGYKSERWGLSLDVLNLLNAQDWDIGYFYDYRLQGQAAVSGTVFHPVIPRAFRGNIYYRF
ncbi:TonB-dependent receptor [Candidatus Nitrosacidococcus tergens]|uniref:TonB-dependent receptor n=1 Tax=Candidatus Nitrosacidococcus tergens TaxID=553981 RepID=A0A7G1Q8A4_9GAMM|nr:TonB-dependent receptor [Candidatus Nitrosacidococcus tergens]CAB1275075.1 TonB-dependent receptor [Candidatus Nitrosacidococcus tergens]